MIGMLATRMTALSMALLTLSIMGCEREGVDRNYMPQIEGKAFYGAKRAWLINWQGDLLRTEDAGDSWETIPAGIVGGFDQITFIDERIGWATTIDGRVVRTTDAGRTWVSISALGDTTWGPGLGQIGFVDEKHGWIVHPLFFWRTEDGGTTWEQSPSPYGPKGSVAYCLFINPKVGWLSGSGGSIYSTQDGGKTWQEQTVVQQDRGLSEVTFVNSLVGWVAASPNDGIYHTEDWGKTWLVLRDPGKIFYLHSVQFTSRTDGWAAGNEGEVSKPSNRKPIVLHTTDGGENWERVKVAQDEPFIHYVHFTDKATGWLLSRDNIYRTDDSGNTWHIVLRLPPVGKQ